MLSNPSSFFLSHVDFVSHSPQLLFQISSLSCQATRRSWHCCLLYLDGSYPEHPEQALSSYFNSQPLYMFTHLYYSSWLSETKSSYSSILRLISHHLLPGISSFLPLVEIYSMCNPSFLSGISSLWQLAAFLFPKSMLRFPES